jgi:DNA-binding LytR/AlgR family response regulator
MTPRALIAEDEPMLRAELREALAMLWPDLELCAEAADGVQALHEWERCRANIVFLDIRMPGLSGLDVARQLGEQCHVVFITAHEEHALQAFEAGAVDYVLKPLALPRLARTVARLKARLDRPPVPLGPVLDRLQPAAAANNGPLRWITVLKGREVRLITVDDICYVRSDNKYTAVVTADSESLVRMPLRDLAARLDPEVFWQVHRNAVVNANAIQSVRRDAAGHLEVCLKARSEVLKVSVGYAHRFRPA